MIKKIFLLLLVVGLSNCDYKPIYQQENDLNLLVKEVQSDGDKKINRRIIKFLKLENNKNKDSKYTLKLNSKKLLEIVSKDKLGNASIYKTTIIVNVLLEDEDKAVKKKTLSSNFVYNTIDNKFDLLQYQRNVEKTLIDKLIEDILIFLNS
mgnify:CR=1 FL=1